MEQMDDYTKDHIAELRRNADGDAWPNATLARLIETVWEYKRGPYAATATDIERYLVGVIEDGMRALHKALHGDVYEI